MANPVHCFDILLRNKLPAAPRVAMLYGDSFLYNSTTARLLEHWKVDVEEIHKLDGEEATWVDIHDELVTPSLFSDATRCIVIGNATPLIRDSRSQLEHWARSAPAGTLLLLQTDTAPGNSNLGQAIAKHGLLVDCRLPTTSARSKTIDVRQVKQWLVHWGHERYGLKLSDVQAAEILDTMGMDCGLLDQELLKLSLFAEHDGTLTDDVLRANVGNWRTRTGFEIADALAAGNVADALRHLDHLLQAGEQALGVLPQIAWSLRRYGFAAHLLLQGKRTGQRMTPRDALIAAGFYPNQVNEALANLKRLGLRRASLLMTWLLELDLKLKGSHANEDRARFALEQFCLRLA